jgi:hypothetical protein
MTEVWQNIILPFLKFIGKSSTNTYGVLKSSQYKLKTEMRHSSNCNETWSPSIIHKKKIKNEIALKFFQIRSGE